jgi:hypothetical protein
MSQCDNLLGKWVKAWREENLSEEISKLISQATFDLYHGPINDGAVGDPAADDEELAKYPGFVTACRSIAKAIDGLPSTLYLCTDTDEVVETEPEEEGFDWWRMDRSDIKKALLGRELAGYV